jgi:Ser/Thr protein kinase RdoA (MazF antagonist)
MTDALPSGHVIGIGKEAEVFDRGPLVLKLYRRAEAKASAFREAAILAVVESTGLPCPTVAGVEQVDGRWGVVMSRAEGPAFAETMTANPGSVPTTLTAMAALHARIHRHEATRLANLKAKLGANIVRAAALDDGRRRRLRERLAALPDGDRLCHGDFHPWNILGVPGAATVVDWLDATSGDPAADVCRSYVLMRPQVPHIAAAYVDAYVDHAGLDRQKIDAWVPVVAAARLAEGVAGETDMLMDMVGTG